MVWDHEAGGSNPLTPTIDMDFSHWRTKARCSQEKVETLILRGENLAAGKLWKSINRVRTCVDNDVTSQKGS